MAITRISQSSVKEGLEKYTSFYGGLSGALFGQYESIATVTVGSGGASSIEFTSIPGTYQHLQLRIIGRQSYSSSSGGYFTLRFNADSGANYTYHGLLGDGAAASAGSVTSQTVAYGQRMTSATQGSNTFGASVIDLLDYASTSKNKTLRNFGGWDSNGSGFVYLSSGAWLSTSALTGIVIGAEGGTFVQHTTAALYGIKAP